MLIRTLLATLLLSAASVAQAQLTDEEIRAEITDWVIEPCMSIAIALRIEDMTQEHVSGGVTREMAAQMGVASRETLIVEMAETLRPDTSWSVRKLMYLNMLRQCLRGSGLRCE